jgi:hypothetical protein
LLVSGWRAPLFYIILTVYLLAGVLFATLTPAWQAPDEPAHYNYVRYLARQSSFPELIKRCYDQAYLEQLKFRRFPAELSLEAVCYEFHQPPLYYLLATPVFLLSDGSLLALRLLSVMLGAGVVILAFFIGRIVFPSRLAIAYGTMAFVAFVPMHAAILASVNNDALAELILAALLLLLIRRLWAGSPPTTLNDVILGGLLGLGLITKTTVYIAIPLIAITLWLATSERHGGGEAAERQTKWPNEARSEVHPAWLRLNDVDWRLLARQLLIIYGLALAIALPWYWRNAGLYGNFDILGLGRHDAVVIGQLRTADYLAETGRRAYLNNFITTTFHSFWGQFGWMAVPMSERVYLALSVLTLAALGGMILLILDFRFWKDVSVLHASRPTRALILMGLAIGLMALGYIWYNLEFVQFQGRYLFPALIPLGLFFSLGLYQAFSLRWAWGLVGGLALVLAWVIVASLLNSDLDKWAVLMIGLLLVLAVARAWLAPRWPIPAAWLMIACYSGLALLTLVSPFWFVVPYLSP